MQWQEIWNCLFVLGTGDRGRKSRQLEHFSSKLTVRYCVGLLSESMLCIGVCNCGSFRRVLKNGFGDYDRALRGVCCY